MKRSSDEFQTSIYSYGCVPERVAPILGWELAEQQLRLANRLWNTLVAIERARSARYRKIMRDDTQARIDELAAKAAELRGEIKARRKQARKRAVDDTELQKFLAEVLSEKKALIEQQRATSKLRHAARKTELEALSTRHNARIKRARQAAGNMGLFWGTYNDIVQRADAARKLGEPKFRRFIGEGTLTAQIIGGTSVERVFGGHTFFQIDSDAHGQKWRYARMRIGSDAYRQPIWIEIPIVYHRDLPSAAVVKSVSMTRRQGRWQLNVMLNAPHPQARTGAAVAIDIGWRLLPAGVRVAYWVDEAGAHGEVVVASSDIAQLEQVRALRSKCDLLRDEFLPALAAWLDGQELSAEWKQQSTAIAQWRSGDRIARLVRWWADHRILADHEIFAAALDWRKQYLHLANWWRSVEHQLRLRIREKYRVFAAQVARQYGEVRVEDFDLRRVARDPLPESSEVKTASSAYRQVVSPSVFRQALLNACRREGVSVTRVASPYTTSTCHACGYADKWDQAEQIIHRCGGCGALWDQDFNAAKNLLASGGAPPTENQQHGGAKIGGTADRSQSGAQSHRAAGVTVPATEVPAQGLGT